MAATLSGNAWSMVMDNNFSVPAFSSVPPSWFPALVMPALLTGDGAVYETAGRRVRKRLPPHLGSSHWVTQHSAPVDGVQELFGTA